MSPYLPVTPEEIAEAAIQAVEAGAAIVHLHARDAVTGKPTQDPAVFAEFLPLISEASDVVVNITTGGSPHMSLDERLQPVLEHVWGATGPQAGPRAARWLAFLLAMRLGVAGGKSLS